MKKILLVLALAVCAGSFAADASSGNAQALDGVRGSGVGVRGDTVVQSPFRIGDKLPSLEITDLQMPERKIYADAAPPPVAAAAPAAAAVTPAALPSWLTPERESMIFTAILAALAFLFARMQTSKADMIVKGVGTAHWVLTQLKAVGFFKNSPGVTEIEEEFFKRFNDRFMLDHSVPPDLNAENAAYALLTQAMSSAASVPKPVGVAALTQPTA